MMNTNQTKTNNIIQLVQELSDKISELENEIEKKDSKVANLELENKDLKNEIFQLRETLLGKCTEDKEVEDFDNLSTDEESDGKEEVEKDDRVFKKCYLGELIEWEKSMVEEGWRLRREDQEMESNFSVTDDDEKEDLENEYSVVWHGNKMKNGKRDYHRQDFNNQKEAIEYYETTAHGWVTGIKSPYFMKGATGNGRMLFRNTEDGVCYRAEVSLEGWEERLTNFYKTGRKTLFK